MDANAIKTSILESIVTRSLFTEEEHLNKIAGIAPQGGANNDPVFLQLITMKKRWTDALETSKITLHLRTSPFSKCKEYLEEILKRCEASEERNENAMVDGSLENTEDVLERSFQS